MICALPPVVSLAGSGILSTEIAVDGFGHRSHLNAENMLIHCPPYHARAMRVCAFTPHCCIRNNS